IVVEDISVRKGIDIGERLIGMEMKDVGIGEGRSVKEIGEGIVRIGC
ncbi:DUF436 family protein, partial [Staphylococcus saprophyticus]